MTAGPATPSPPRKVPVGVKLLIGCVAVLALGFGGLAVAVGVGGFVLKRGLDAVADHAEDQREATALLDRLERDYQFRPATDGLPSPAERGRFAAVTERAWSGMRDWAEDARALDSRGAARPGRQTTLGDAVTAARAADGAVRSRVVLVRALAAERMSLSEYLWTGRALLRDGPRGLASDRVRAGDAELVLNMAMTWGRAERVPMPPAGPP